MAHIWRCVGFAGICRTVCPIQMLHNIKPDCLVCLEELMLKCNQVTICMCRQGSHHFTGRSSFSEKATAKGFHTV